MFMIIHLFWLPLADDEQVWRVKLAHPVEAGSMASLTFFISCIIRTVYMVVFEPHSFLLTLWTQQVRTATLARQRQVHSFRCTEPRD